MYMNTEKKALGRGGNDKYKGNNVVEVKTSLVDLRLVIIKHYLIKQKYNKDPSRKKDNNK